MVQLRRRPLPGLPALPVPPLAHGRKHVEGAALDVGEVDEVVRPFLSRHRVPGSPDRAE